MIASEAYFHQPAPKSTGTEYFNPEWLAAFVDESADVASIQATLVELTAVSIAKAIRTLPALPGSCYLCGGGARNHFLVERLALALPECTVTTTAELGLDVDFVEACAFAWLARERINLRPANVLEVTRARQKALLGGIYAAD